MFPNCHLNTRGVVRIWDSYANQRGSRGLHNCREFLLLPECFDDAFKNYFSKIIRQIKGNAVYLLLDRKRFSLYAPYFLPTNRNVHLQHTTNQNSYDVTTVFTYSNLNIPTDQTESAHYPNYFMIAIFSFSDPTSCLESYNVSLLMSIKWTPVYWG